MLFFVRFNRVTGYWEMANSNHRNDWQTIEINGEKLKTNNRALVREYIANKMEMPIESIEILIARPRGKEDWDRVYYK